jgi:cytochrome c-type biogenesis protein
MDVTLSAAFIAGLFSFLSPCVLPLVPAYISYLTARATNQSNAELRMAGSGATVAVNRGAVFLHGVFFVAGFTLVFVGLGMLANVGLQSIAGAGNTQVLKTTMYQVGGGIVILFGLHVMGVTEWVINQATKRLPAESSLNKFLGRVQSVLYADTRREMNVKGGGGYLGSSAMGMAFAAGWSPCIGPILGAILTIAATASTGDVWLSAGVPLFIYSMGLAVPFLLSAAAINRMRGVMRRLQRHMANINRLSGAMLILMGFLLYQGELERLAQTSGGFADFTFKLQECTAGLFNSSVTAGEWGMCMQHGINFRAKLALADQQPAGGITDAGPIVPAATAPASSVVPVVPTLPPNLDVPLGLKVGQMIPNIESTFVDGAAFSLEDYRGKVVVLNFWATWCGPCRDELPIFQKVAEKYADQGLVLITINHRETPAQIQKYLEESGLSFKVVLDPKGQITQKFWGSGGLPATYVIGRDGLVLVPRYGAFDLTNFDAEMAAWLKR